MSAVDSVIAWAKEKSEQFSRAIDSLPLLNPLGVASVANSAITATTAALQASHLPDAPSMPLSQRLATAAASEMQAKAPRLSNPLGGAPAADWTPASPSSGSPDIPTWLKVTIGASLVLGTIIFVKGLISE